jgi:hypothetical protein
MGSKTARGAASAAAFDQVEIAIGGIDRRNRVVRVTDVPTIIASSGRTDCFVSVLRFTQEFARYTATNPSPKTGNPPSVSGYSGPALPKFLPLDFDHEQDPTRALADVRGFLRRLHDQYDVPAEALRLFFSGLKGFAVEIPGMLVGGFEPNTDIANRLRRAAYVLVAGFSTADLAIYDRLRLWRVPNTRHKSGLFKVPLSAAEVMHLSLDDIRAVARAPRQIDLPDESEFQPHESLVQLWLSTASSATSERGNGGEKYPQRDPRHTRGEWRELLGSRFAQPGRHDALKKCAAYFFATQRDPTIARIITHDWNATHCVPPKSAEEVDDLCDWILAKGLKGGRR